MVFDIKLNLSEPKLESSNVKVHSLPCKINLQGSSEVDHFFSPYLSDEPNNAVSPDHIKCSFRGVPLTGSKVTIPPGYTGIVVEDIEKSLTDEQENKILVSNKSFNNFVYWKWDMMPSISDPYIKLIVIPDSSKTL
nr:EOG090X0IC1 [Scapholeberis mucronata]